MQFMGGAGLESILGHGKLGSWHFRFDAMQGARSFHTVLQYVPHLMHPMLGKQAYAVVCVSSSKSELSSVYPSNEPSQPSRLLRQTVYQCKRRPLEKKLWQQGCRFSFQKNKQFIKACSSAISKCIAASSPARLNLRLKEVEGKPQM